jgi:superfamily II DNA or RNA helicase
MGRREELQQLFGERIRDYTGDNASLICPRFGKCRMILKHTIREENILICYPSLDIQKSWFDDIDKWGKGNCDITYSTFLSLGKLKGRTFDKIVIDEAHKLSPKQRENLKNIFGRKIYISGTISPKTEEWMRWLNIPIITKYTTSEGIEDGIITDFEINVIYVSLDESLKDEYRRTSYVIEAIMFDPTKRFQLKMLSLKRMRILHSNPNKIKVVKQLIKDNTDKRLLVFSSETKLLDQFEIPSYHSKNHDEQLKEDFCSGKGNILGVLKMFNQGVTVKPINMCILHNFTSNPENLEQQLNRITGFEYDNPNKKAIVYIICTKETQEVKWLHKALAQIPKDKIKYL